MRVSGTLALTLRLRRGFGGQAALRRGRNVFRAGCILGRVQGGIKSMSMIRIKRAEPDARAKRNQAEQPAGICGKRRNKRRNKTDSVPPFHAFLRLTGKKHSHGWRDELTIGICRS
jgi:hypothetical protein